MNSIRGASGGGRHLAPHRELPWSRVDPNTGGRDGPNDILSRCRMSMVSLMYQRCAARAQKPRRRHVALARGFWWCTAARRSPGSSGVPGGAGLLRWELSPEVLPAFRSTSSYAAHMPWNACTRSKGVAAKAGQE
jgi:hypothetical protein